MFSGGSNGNIGEKRVNDYKAKYLLFLVNLQRRSSQVHSKGKGIWRIRRFLEGLGTNEKGDW